MISLRDIFNTRKILFLTGIAFKRQNTEKVHSKITIVFVQRKKWEK